MIQNSSWFNSLPERFSVVLICSEESEVIQSEKENCDINNVIARYARIGSLPPAPENVFDDVSSLQVDFTELMQKKLDTMKQYEADLKVHAEKLEKEKLEETDKLKARIAELEAASKLEGGTPGGDSP